MLVTDKLRRTVDEMDGYFAAFDHQREVLEPLCDEILDLYRGEPFRQKTGLMRLLAEKSDIKVFRYFPFWNQLTAGRVRRIWGGLDGGCGARMYYREGAEPLEIYREYFAADRADGHLYNWNNPVGLDHHALNYDDILALGLDGLKEKAEQYAKACTDPKKLAFYAAAKESLDILAALSKRFADEAARMLETETDEAARINLARIAKTAAEVPMRPAETFYEALAAIFFCREAVGTLEGIGVSTFGQLDRMLLPYYERDLAAGRLTRDEARDLLSMLFVYTAVRFDENEQTTLNRETSTTIILGGCDEEGAPIYNEVTRLILEAEEETRTVNLKLDCRVSKAHPAEYFERLCEMQLDGLACIVLLNDDVYIPARVKLGQDIRDVRRYVAGGCHEIVLGGTEVCTRADTWIGLPRILLDTMEKGGYADFEEFYAAAIGDVRAYHLKVEAAKNAFEERWSLYDPMPLYSTMMTGCLEKGTDLTAGGSKYANTALSMLGPATFIDSLYAVKKLCFDEKKLTMKELCAVLDADFAENESLRQYILNRIPKYGSGNEELDAFTVRVFHDLSTVSGRENGRGGKYLPAFYAHDIFRPMGEVTAATPDGRRKGYYLSRGCSPSEFLSGITPTDMLTSIRNIDFTEYGESHALEMTLPRLKGEEGKTIMMAIIMEFLENEGGTLQFNLLDHEMLREAQREPDKHRDLMVRICGYSYYFVCLTKDIQDEIIARATR
ncbi:MAG: hypothetical protein IJD13_00265 [Oscillospiraceae bacterium]|nr:hypothetical protein [Oscillospiraceae bacterium]